MRKTYGNIVHFLKDDYGVTSIEYALLASLIAIAIVTGASLLGTNLNELYFSKVANAVSNALGSK